MGNVKKCIIQHKFWFQFLKKRNNVLCGAAWLYVCIQDLTGIFSAALMVLNLANRMVCI